MQDLIINRLMTEHPGKGLMITGYEKHENGLIYHKRWNSDTWRDVLSYTIEGTKARALCYLHHVRKDRYAGISINKQLLFERDEVFYRVLKEDDSKGIIRFNKGEFEAIDDDNIDDTASMWYLSCDIRKTKIVGTEGVLCDILPAMRLYHNIKA